jgi:outer membrane lipoprotein SlyB
LIEYGPTRLDHAEEQNMKRVASLATVLVAASLAAGCATQRHEPMPASAPTYPAYPANPAPQVAYGHVHSIDLIRAENQTTGAGGLVGGVVGAVVGRQIGSGSGRSVGTLVGAVGGAIIGNQIEKNNRGARDFYRVAVRTDQGQIRSFDYQQLAELHVGDRVRIDGNQVYRY